MNNYSITTVHKNKTCTILDLYIQNNVFKLSLDLELEKSSIVKIYNLDGKLVLKNRIAENSSKIEISLSDFPNGIYLIKFEGSVLEKLSYKILKYN